MTLVPASSHGAAAFNGGTITQKLTVDTAATTTQALELTGTRTSENDVFRIDYPHSVVVFDSDGAYTFTCNDGPSTLFDATGGTDNTVRIRADGNAGLTIIGNNAAGGGQATLGCTDGTGTVSVHADTGVILVTGGATVAQLGMTVFKFQATAAPADGTLVNSQCALWLDDTPGATKLMVKAKDSGGTVRAAAIALA